MKEFKFDTIAARQLYWWEWVSDGVIWEVTSFYMTATWANTMNYDFEIMEKGIEKEFQWNTAWIRKVNDQKIEVCTKPWVLWKCYYEEWNLAEKFIQKYNIP